MKICRETPNLVKNRAQILGTFHLRIKYVVLLPETQIHHKTYLCNTLCCYTPERKIRLNNQQKALLPYIYNSRYPKAPKCYIICQLPGVFLTSGMFVMTKIQGGTKKTGTFEKTQQKLKKSKKKNLLAQIEPLQLAF